MKSSRVLLVLCATVALLAALCCVFPEEGIAVGNTTLRFPSLYKVLVGKEKGPSLEEILAQKHAEYEVELQGFNDSVRYFQTQIDSSNLAFSLPDGDWTFFDTLFARMEQAAAQGVHLRVLHYGDSQIEMDRMSAQLRTHLQALFGGGGPGMLPFVQNIPSSTVWQNAAGAFTQQSSYGNLPRANGNYGPRAQCCHVSGVATLNINASQHHTVDERAKHFSRVKLLFCNRPGPLQASLACARTKYDTLGVVQWTQQCEKAGVHAFEWVIDSSVSSLKLTVQGDADLYAVLVDDRPGVAVDNIPLRGCSGQQFCMIDASQLSAAYRQMDVGLIVMQFGGNSVPYLKGQRNIETYAASIGRQIDRVRQCCPEATVLFVGPSDMSTMVAGELQSYPAMENIIDALRDTTNAHGAAYWSIYHAMGGRNSMVTWASNGLAGTDYIHFSNKGVELMGNRFAQAFEQMYDLYCFRKHAPTEQPDSLYYDL